MNEPRRGLFSWSHPPPLPRPPGPISRWLWPMLTVLGMLSIYVLGFQLRGGRLESSGGHEGVYWMESAQRFRYVARVASGEGLPTPDPLMQTPEGYDPRSDTVLQEWLYGISWRLLGVPQLGMTAYVRLFTRVFFCLGLFPLLAWSGRLARSRSAALLACLGYAVCLPAVERSAGVVLFREHVAIPFYLFHLYFLTWHLQRGRRELGLASGVFFLLSLLSWKVMGLVMLVELGFFFLLSLTNSSHRRSRAALAGLVLVPLVASFVPGTHLHIDRFWLQPAALLGVGLVVAEYAAPRRPGWQRVLLALSLFTMARVLLPGPPGYSHAFETILARARFLGAKPDDPGALSFHARHFWTGNYRSPTLRRLVRDFLPQFLLGVGGLWVVGRGLRRRHLDLGAACWAVLALGLGVSYLVFFKLQALAALVLSPGIALAWDQLVSPERGRRARWAARAGLLLLIGVSWAQTAARLPTFDRWLPAPERAPERTLVHTGAALGELSGFLDAEVGPGEGVAAGFVLSPYLLAYGGHAVALNCFFEGPALERYQQFTEALYASPAELTALLNRWEVRWLVVEAHMDTRRDDAMSYRYVADQLDAGPDEALRQLAGPVPPQGYALRFENDYFRVFEVGGEARGGLRSAPRPLWSPPLRAALARGPAWRGVDAREVALYQLIEADQRLSLALGLAALEEPPLGRIRSLVDEAAGLAPWAPQVYRAQAQILEQLGGPAEVPLAREAELHRALLGQGPIEPFLAPPPG